MVTSLSIHFCSVQGSWNVKFWARECGVCEGWGKSLRFERSVCREAYCEELEIVVASKRHLLSLTIAPLKKVYG